MFLYIKKNDPSNIEHYRPIALLSVFSKIFEKAYKSRLLSFLEKHGLLTPRQYGFRRGCSTQDAILSFYEKILNGFNNKQSSAGIFFDMSRAFDTINHRLLLYKLHLYGIRGPAWDWIKSYLSGRTQTVRISENGKSYLSESVDVNTGVPQGSVLGPLLFIIFINDIATYIADGFLTLFADDLSGLITGENVNEVSKRLNKLADQTKIWCSSNDLVLNSKKTDLLLYTPIGIKPDSSLLIRSGSNSLIQKNQVKFLGLQMDKHLSWEAHINDLSSRLATKNFMIRRLRDSVNINTLKTFYYGSINSILLYGIICWGNCSGINQIFIHQKRILRSMLKLPYNTPCRLYFKQEGILTIPCMYILESVCYVRKNIKDLKKCGDINKYTTRSASNLYVPAHRITQVEKGPFISSIKMYNHLPENIKNGGSFNHFKHLVKQFLIEHCFYSVREYNEYCDSLGI